MKIAVTGASGHVGANLCRQLLQSGHKVKVLIHNDIKALEGLNVEIVHGDVLLPGSLMKLCQDTEVVFHLAAIISINKKNKKNLFDVNIEGARNIIHACIQNRVRRLVYFSTIHVFKQDPIDATLDESRPMIEDSKFLYEASKAQCVKMIQEQVKNGLEVVTLHPTSIIGPNDFKPSFMGQIFIKLYQRKLPGMVHGGYDWVDVRDIARGAISAMEQGRNGEKYILSGKWRSFRSLAGVYEQCSGIKAPGIMFPDWMARPALPLMQLLAKLNHEQPLYTNDSLNTLKLGNRHIDHSKAARELNYNVRPLKETLVDTIRWFKSNQYV